MAIFSTRGSIAILAFVMPRSISGWSLLECGVRKAYYAAWLRPAMAAIATVFVNIFLKGKKVIIYYFGRNSNNF